MRAGAARQHAPKLRDSDHATESRPRLRHDAEHGGTRQFLSRARALGRRQPSKQPVDCSNLRVIAFNGDQRTDSRGGVPAYRNVSVTPLSGSSRVVDEFNTGQIRARVTFTLRQVDPNNVEMDQERGGLLKLQRCK